MMYTERAAADTWNMITEIPAAAARIGAASAEASLR